MSTILAEKNKTAVSTLHRKWWGITAVWLLCWAGGYSWLRLSWSDYATRWAAISAIALAYGLWIIRRHLASNHRTGERELLTSLGWGNGLSIMRGLAIGCVAGFLFSPWPLGALGWVPVLLYTVADIADYFDGYIARKTNHATELGAVLDIEFDGLGMFIVSILGVWYGQLPWWYLLLGMARYIFLMGMWWRERAGKPLHDLHPSVHRRVFAGFQMGFMSAILWPIIPSEATTIAGTLFAIPTALGFYRDWLVVSGRLDVRNGRYQTIQQFLVKLCRIWAPPILRLSVVVCMGIILAAMSNKLIPPPWQQLLISWGVPLTAVLAGLLGITAWLGTLLLAAGAMGRLLSILIVFPIGFDIASGGLTIANGLALGCAVCLMLFGTGPFSLWTPEERFVFERLG